MGKIIPAAQISKGLLAGLSANQLSNGLCTSKQSVREVKEAVEKRNDLTLYKLAAMSDKEAYCLLFPERDGNSSSFIQPDYGNIHKELLKKGITLQLLYDELIKQNTNSNKKLPSYSKFCRDYRKYTLKKNMANHLYHKPGHECEVDWAGTTMKYYDSKRGKYAKAYIFAAVLPYSQMAYFEACPSMESRDWIQCHINMFNYFGGVTTVIICDNLKTGVIKNPGQGEIQLNREYENLSRHYNCAILPTHIRAPREKNSVEGLVGFITRTVIAGGRNIEFKSLEELKIYIRKGVDDINSRPFQKREGSRRSCFESEEKKYLHPLPIVPYRLDKWCYNHKIALDSYAVYNHNHYSVPYQYIGSLVDFRIADKTIEIYKDYERIAIHPLFEEGEKNKYRTEKSHLPKDPSKMEMNRQRIEEWAAKIGPSTSQCIEKIFQGVTIEQQAYNPALAILKISKKEGAERLENACACALRNYEYPRYKQISAILKLNIDSIANEKEASQEINRQATMGLIRGSTFYQGDK